MAEIPFDSGFLDRDGERVYWQSIGSGDPLVLAHGAGGNHAVWFQQLPFFAPDRRVITFDHRGFGRSTATQGPTTPALASADLIALLDALGVGRADLIGQSMGGWTVLRAALDHPARVRSLVLSNTPGGIETEELARTWREFPAAASFNDGFARSRAFAASFGERDPERAHLYTMLGGFGEPELAKIAPSLVTAMVPRSELLKLQCRVLLTTGDGDALFSPDLIRASAALVPGARLHVFEGAGHSPYYEMPGEWNRVISAFLAG